VITIIDYGTGNIGSIANMLKKIGAESLITADPQKIDEAEKLVLCGIGAFDDGMIKLEEMGIVDVLKKKAMEDKTPILGICLGMQLFTKGSEEGKKQGLGFVAAETKKFHFNGMQDNSSLRIPHIGWNDVELSKSSKLFENMHDEPRFYFVHSYYVELKNKEDELLSTTYGYGFSSGFEKDNIIGVQFHPEKSHKFGMKLFENFAKNY
jgi:imidazole glycerol-phosphate synthase subunit HisH